MWQNAVFQPHIKQTNLQKARSHVCSDKIFETQQQTLKSTNKHGVCVCVGIRQLSCFVVQHDSRFQHQKNLGGSINYLVHSSANQGTKVGNCPFTTFIGKNCHLMSTLSFQIIPYSWRYQSLMQQIQQYVSCLQTTYICLFLVQTRYPQPHRHLP